MIVLHVVALLVGSVLFSVMYETIQARGETVGFSLPLSNILLVTVLGTVLSFWWGWYATVLTLAAYGLYCVIAGLLDR